MSDPRFSRFKTDPRFRKLHKKQNKIVIDERFKSVFTKDSGNPNKATQVDKYGRKLSKNHDTENLKRFYRLEGDEELVTSSVPDYARGEILMESSDEDEGEGNAEESELEDEPVILGKDSRKPIPVGEEIEVDLDESQFAELDALAEANVKKSREEEQAVTVSDDEQTNRLAVVNLDWDHVKASHLYKIVSSVLTPLSKKGTPAAPIGKVLNVRIYPSEFGKSQMEREAKEGPPKEIFKKRGDEDGDSDVQEDDGADYDEDALRKYQLLRLRYYYAIITCDTAKAAAHIVSELDGTELERSANMFDFSYVPKDMSFGDDYTDEASEEGTTYKAVEFVTDALRHSRVKLTWDADDPERVKMTRRAFSKKELEEADFQAFLASASSDDGSDNEDDAQSKREKVRSLLLKEVEGDNERLPEGWGKDFDKGGEMEITFTPGLSGSNNNVDPEEETTLQRYLRKEKEKKKKRKEKYEKPKQDKEPSGDEFFGEDDDEESVNNEPSTKKGASKNADVAELELLQSTLGEDQEPQHFHMRDVIKAEKEKTKKRRKERKRQQGGRAEEIQEDFVLDVNDSRFKALHEDHAFAIDPSNPHFKKTKNMSVLLEERAKRQQSKQNSESSTEKSAMNDGSTDGQSLRKLVENVKRKSTLSNSQRGEVHLNVTVTAVSMSSSSEHSSINWQQLIAAFSPGNDFNYRTRFLYELSKYISAVRKEQKNVEEGTNTLIVLLAPVLESQLAETDEATLVPTLYFFSTLFQLDTSAASELFCRDGVLSSVMDIPDILPSSKTTLHAIAELLSQASSSKQCRSLMSSTEVRTWLESSSEQTNDPPLQATAALTLVKLFRGLEEDSQNASVLEQTSPIDYNWKADQLFESMKNIVSSSPTTSSLSPAVFDSIEGLAYLTVRSNFRELLADDSIALKDLMNLARGQAKPSFPSSYQQVSHAKTPLEYDFGMNYGISAIILNLSSYKRRLSEEEKQVEKLRAMTKLPNSNSSSTEKNAVPQTDDALEDDDHVRVRCKKLLQAGAAEALSSIVRNVAIKGSGKRSIAIHRTAASALLHLSEDKDNRGKILQAGGVKTLLSIIQASLEELLDAKLLDSKKIDLLDTGDLQAIQALAKLTITSPPSAVFGPNQDAYIDAIRPFTILLIHSSSSLLQKFEAIMALTNLASISHEAAERLATFRLQTTSTSTNVQPSTGIIVQRCEHLLLDNNFMVRRAATELICNLVGGSETAFDYFGGSAEGSAKSKLHILVALSDVEDLPTRLAASGALAVLTASPYACRSLAELELEQHRVVPIIVGLIAPAIAAEYREEGEEEQLEISTDVEDVGLVHRGVVCIRNIFANLDSREERIPMSVEGEKRGLVRALVHVVKNTPGGPNNATIIKPAAEVLKWMIEAGIKLPL